MSTYRDMSDLILPFWGRNLFQCFNFVWELDRVQHLLRVGWTSEDRFCIRSSNFWSSFSTLPSTFLRAYLTSIPMRRISRLISLKQYYMKHVDWIGRWDSVIVAPLQVFCAYGNSTDNAHNHPRSTGFHAPNVIFHLFLLRSFCFKRFALTPTAPSWFFPVAWSVLRSAFLGASRQSLCLEKQILSVHNLLRIAGIPT